MKHSGIRPYASPYALCAMLMAEHTSRFHGRLPVVERLLEGVVAVVRGREIEGELHVVACVLPW